MDNLNDLFRPIDYGVSLETTETITPRKVRIDGKRKMITCLKKEKAKDLLGHPPKPNEFFHIVSNGSFDYWQLCPLLIELTKAKNVTIHASTWTLNRQNALEMLEMLDDGRCGSLHLLTGTYFKRRESAVFATIANGLMQRKQKIRALENHAKVLLIDDHAGNYFVMEGSANFTANPRIEQNIIGNNRELYEHHRGWIEEAFTI